MFWRYIKLGDYFFFFFVFFLSLLLDFPLARHTNNRHAHFLCILAKNFCTLFVPALPSYPALLIDLHIQISFNHSLFSRLNTPAT